MFSSIASLIIKLNYWNIIYT